MEDFIYFSVKSLLPKTIYRDANISMFNIDYYIQGDYKRLNSLLLLERLAKKLFVVEPLIKIYDKFRQYVQVRKEYYQYATTKLSDTIMSVLNNKNEYFVFNYDINRAKDIRGNLMLSTREWGDKAMLSNYKIRSNDDVYTIFAFFIENYSPLIYSYVNNAFYYVRTNIEYINDKRVMREMCYTIPEILNLSVENRFVSPVFDEKNVRTPLSLDYFNRLRVLKCFINCIETLLHKNNEIIFENTISSHPAMSLIWDQYKYLDTDPSTLLRDNFTPQFYNMYFDKVTQMHSRIINKLDNMIDNDITYNTKEGDMPEANTNETSKTDNVKEIINLEALSNIQQQLLQIQLQLQNQQELNNLDDYQITTVDGQLLLVKKDKLMTRNEKELLMNKNLEAEQYLQNLIDKSFREILTTAKNFAQYTDNITRSDKDRISRMNASEANLVDVITILDIINDSFRDYFYDYEKNRRSSKDVALNSKITKSCYIVTTNLIPSINQLKIVYNLLETPQISKKYIEDIIAKTNVLLQLSNKCIAVVFRS